MVIILLPHEKLSSGQTTREELLELLRNWERTRPLIFWSDHSSLMNHGHILLTVHVIDPPFYFTSEELNGLDVKELVAKPQIYL